METGQGIVNAARAWLARYAALSSAENLVLALWALHTHVYQKLSRTVPYIEITGSSGSGKTTIMEAVFLLCRGGMVFNTIPVKAICRYITARKANVTIGIDEAERLASATFGDQRSMMASGYRQGGVHPVSSGDDTKLFGVWCPKIFTSTRSLTEVLHNRSICVWAEPGKPACSLSKQYETAETTANAIVNAFLTTKIADLFHDVPTVDIGHLGTERDQEIWNALFTLARTLRVDEETYNELIAASVDLTARRGVLRVCDGKGEDEAKKTRTFALRLIADIHATIKDDDPAILPTEWIITRLKAINEGPWRHYRDGLNEHHLGQLLGAFDVKSKVGQFGRGKTRKQYNGYVVASLRSATLRA